MHRPPSATWLLSAILVTGLALGAASARASEPLLLDGDEPEDLAELRDETAKIDAAMGAAVCGGVLQDEPVGKNLGEAVPVIVGLPGRLGQPLGAVLSGLGLKDFLGGQLDDGFQYPPSAVGLSTRCLPGVTGLRKLVFAQDRLTYVHTPIIEAPFFGDPPCLTTPGDCENFCRELNTFTYPDCAVLKGDGKRGIGCAVWCLKETCTDGWTDKCSESLSDVTGGALADSPEVPELRVYQGRLVFFADGFYRDYETLAPVFNQTGQFLNEGETEFFDERLNLDTPQPAYPNCVPCAGEECRCSLQVPSAPEKNPACLLVVPDVDVGQPSLVNLPQADAQLWRACRSAGLNAVESNDPRLDQERTINPQECLETFGDQGQGLAEGVYASFFRQYDAIATRRAFTQVAPADQNKKEARVACYGLYDEFDPLNRQTEMVPGVSDQAAKDARCVIDLDTTNFNETQLGTGNRPTRPNPADFTSFGRSSIGVTPWYQGLGGAFSLLHADDNGQADTLATAALAITATDTAALQALPQLHRASLTDFDESGTHRTIVTWWSHLTAVLNEATSQPVFTLLLSKLPDIAPDPEDPLFTNVVPEKLPATDPTAPFEVQLGVGEDLPGQVADFLRRNAIFRVEETPMPALLPAGTPEDWRALAQGWCTYVTGNEEYADFDDGGDDEGESAEGCDESTLVGGAPETAAFLKKLEEYATRIEEVASLRAELAKTLTALLVARQDQLQVIANWQRQAKAAVLPTTAETERIERLRKRWQEVSRAYTAVGAVTNMPWCMNQRFTLPITWLLDPWLPSREQDGLISADGLPLPFFEKRRQDLELDFSLLDLHQGHISVPVLKPVQVRLDLAKLAPPGSDDELKIPRKLPEFPRLTPIKDALQEARQTLARVQVLSEPPLPQRPAFLSLKREEELMTALDEAETMITGMNEAYRRFWEPLAEEHTDDREALSCAFWGEGICHYSEMELAETLMRMMSRVAVFMDEDLLALRPFGRLTSTACTLDTGGCTPLPPVSRPAPQGWQVVAPRDDSKNLDDSRRKIRAATLPTTIDDFAAATLAEIPWSYEGPDLLPGLAVPEFFDLIAPASSSSAPTP